MNRFENKAVIITGAAGGIGEATTRRIVSEGGKVVIADHSKEKAEQLAAELTQSGADVRPIYFSATELQSCKELIDYLSVHTDVVPKDDDDELEALDYALASLAIEVAVTRHAGHLEQYYSPMGISYMQIGKDLTAVKTVIVTGGALIHTKRTAQIASHALFNPLDAFSLKPKEAQVLVDRKYILAAMGILSTEYPQTALRIMKKELVKDGNH